MKFTKRTMEPREEGGGNFLKLKDGDQVKVVFVGEIFEFYQSWPFGGEKQIYDKPTAGACPRFKVNLALIENGKLTIKIWEFGLPIYIQLGDINEVYPLEKTKIQLTRRGEGKKTTYAILPLIKDAISYKLSVDIKGLKLNVLGQQPKTSTEQIENDTPWPTSENDSDSVPF